MVQNRIFWTIGEQLYIIDDPIISYRKIKVYRVEIFIWKYPIGTMVPVGRFCWKNGVSGKYNCGKYYGT